MPPSFDLNIKSNTDNLLILWFCIAKYDEERRSTLTKLRVPGNLEKCCHIKFEDKRGVCTTLARAMGKKIRRKKCEPS